MATEMAAASVLSLKSSLNELTKNGTSLNRQQCLATIVGSFFFFVLMNLLAGVYLKLMFKSLRTHSNFWRFKNTFLSWTHALIASSLVLVNICKRPELFDDMMFVKTRLAYFAICVSLGYFAYDAADILYSNKKLKPQSYEVLLHHIIIFITFSVTIMFDRFVGYTMAALSIEFNTFFLHLRFMFVFHDYDKSKPAFRLVAILNLMSFIIFRILTLCWMIRWIVINKKMIAGGFFAVGSIGLAVMMVINIILLNRLLQADFKQRMKSTTTSNSKQEADLDKNYKRID